ncbi:hypothetical protein HanHA300_Chr03g0080271 [Helianthus annuus]|nr:hypothetical protein HanHA300_Chr03g0080271 [Helianthus annuus]KAJ0767078.1 hypothetical protein HanLR1_Chr03g0084941 [Helianthus annuus]
MLVLIIGSVNEMRSDAICVEHVAFKGVQGIKPVEVGFEPKTSLEGLKCLPVPHPLKVLTEFVHSKSVDYKTG